MRVKYMFIICILSFLIGCSSSGGGGTDTGTGSLSQEEAEAIAMQLVGGAVGGAFPSSSAKQPSAAPGAPSAPAVPCENLPINISTDINVSCAYGGYIHALGSATGYVNSCGSAFISIGVTETINDCILVDGGLTFNGDPYISAVATFTFLNGVPATQQNISIGGGVKWGTTPADSCQIDLSTIFNFNSGYSETTGTICGRSIDIVINF